MSYRLHYISLFYLIFLFQNIVNIDGKDFCEKKFAENPCRPTDMALAETKF